MEMDQLPPPPLRIDHEVVDHKLEKIEKKLECLLNKRERLATSMQQSLNLAAMACAIYVAILGFVVAYGNNPARIKCSLTYLFLAFISCGTVLGLVLYPLYVNYLKNHKELSIVKFKKKNLKKKRDLLKLGQRQGKFPNDNPKFYLIGQLSKMKIIRLAERTTAQAERFVVGLLVVVLVASIGLFSMVIIDPCGPPISDIPHASGIPSPSPSPSPYN